MRVEEAIAIDRSIDEVFAYLADVERHCEWVSSVLETSRTSDGPMGLGAMFVEDAKFLGRRDALRWAISAYEPPHIIEQWVAAGPARIAIRTTLEAAEGERS